MSQPLLALEWTLSRPWLVKSASSPMILHNVPLVADAFLCHIPNVNLNAAARNLKASIERAMLCLQTPSLSLRRRILQLLLQPAKQVSRGEMLLPSISLALWTIHHPPRNSIQGLPYQDRQPLAPSPQFPHPTLPNPEALPSSQTLCFDSLWLDSAPPFFPQPLAPPANLANNQRPDPSQHTSNPLITHPLHRQPAATITCICSPPVSAPTAKAPTPSCSLVKPQRPGSGPMPVAAHPSPTHPPKAPAVTLSNAACESPVPFPATPSACLRRPCSVSPRLAWQGSSGLRLRASRVPFYTA